MMSLRIPFTPGWVSGAAAALALILAPTLSQATGEPDTAGDAPLITYAQHHGMLGHGDREPLLRIYASGQVQVHRQPHMRGAGDYSMQLEAAELARLLTMLEQEGLTGWDAAEVSARRSALSEQRSRASDGRARGYVNSDPTDTRLILQLPSRDGSMRQQDIVWRDVGMDARAFPTLGPVQALARVARELDALVWHPALRPLAGGAK